MTKIDKACYFGLDSIEGKPAARPAMNVSLTKELEDFVATKVKGGRYRTASEVVREALRLLERRELEEDVLRGIHSGEPTEVTPVFWENMRAALLARHGSGS